MVFFCVPKKGIKHLQFISEANGLIHKIGQSWIGIEPTKMEKEWDDWVTKGKGRVSGVIFYRDIKPADIPWEDVRHIIRFYRSDLQQAYLPLDEEITGELITRL